MKGLSGYFCEEEESGINFRFKTFENKDPVNFVEIMKKPKRFRKRVRFCVISDTHGKHLRLNLEEYGCDVLLHCGDFTTWNDWKGFSNWKVPKTAIEFNDYLGTLKYYRHKIIAIGNHDEGFVKEYCEDFHKYPEEKRMELARNTISNGTILDDELIVIEGIRIFVLSYNYKKYKRKLKWPEVEKMIPEDIDILVCHFPPKFAGDSGLYDIVFRKLKRLKVVCYGHFHKKYGISNIGGKTFISAASFSKKGMNPVVVFDYYL